MFLFNFILSYWVFCASTSLSLLLLHFFKFTPSIPTWSQMITWGKALPPSSSNGWYMLPKRLFFYFYLIGSVVNSIIWLKIAISVIDLTQHTRGPYLPLHTASYILFLSTFQSFRRLYECFFVSKFSTSARMHICYAITGFSFYSMVAVTVLASTGRIYLDLLPIAFFLSPCVIIGTLLFIFASYHQYVCHGILGRLREGPAAAAKYVIPYGDWFRFLSGPHYVAEILIYLSYLVVSGGGCLLIWLMTMYVCFAMTYSCVTTHKWYTDNFKGYPKERRSLLPFIY